MLTDNEFGFEGQIPLGNGYYIPLDCAYVSNGERNPPTIRVNDAFNGRDTGYDLDVGEPLYDTLLAQAELNGAKCVEADAAADANAYRYDRALARTLSVAAE